MNAMLSINPSKDYVIIRMIEGLHAILQPFEGLQMQSLNPSKDYVIIRRVEALHVILQPFK